MAELLWVCGKGVTTIDPTQAALALLA